MEYEIKEKVICKNTNDSIHQIWKGDELIRDMIGSHEMAKILIDEIKDRDKQKQWKT